MLCPLHGMPSLSFLKPIPPSKLGSKISFVKLLGFLGAEPVPNYMGSIPYKSLKTCTPGHSLKDTINIP